MQRRDIALVILQVAPALAGLVLVYLVFAATKLIELRAGDRIPKRDLRSFESLTLWSGVAVMVSLVSTVVTFGWLRDWWSGFGLVAALFLLSLLAIAGLTIMAVLKAGAIGKP